MSRREGFTVLGGSHARFFWLLMASYAVAAIWPAPGLRLRDATLGTVHVAGGSVELTLPAAMLGVLLLNAGLGVRAAELRRLARQPAPLVAGLAANLLVPLVFIVAVALGLRGWHNPDELQSILVGLALVASMPIAGSSSAWSQNAEGNLALSLGLVVGSTLVSPLTTPLALHAVGLLAKGEYAESLHRLAGHDTGAFLAACVVGPALLGIGLRIGLGERRSGALRPWLKRANAANLLVLCYSNAALSLPQAIARADLDFLAAIIAITGGLCALAFGAGWGLGRLLGLDPASRTSLMYGLGMNNNGTGLVLASLAFADRPRVLLPIILYNLVQQVLAGLAGGLFGADRGRQEPRPAAMTAGAVAA